MPSHTKQEGDIRTSGSVEYVRFLFGWKHGATACSRIPIQSTSAISYEDLNKVFGLALTIVALDAVGLDGTCCRQDRMRRW